MPSILKNHSEIVAAITCALLVTLSWFCLQLGWLGVALLLLPAAYVVGGYESAKEGLTTLWEEKELDVDLLMIVAALGAAALGIWQKEYHLIVDGAVLILIFSISGALETYAMGQTERSIRGLMSLTSDTATALQRNGQEEVKEISKLRIGDQVLVRPGELIPVDGLIIEGESTLNEAPITGESLPVEKRQGDEVFAGTINGRGVLKLEIHKPPESNLIQRVIQLVQEAQTQSPPSQQFIEQFERGYAKVIVLAGLGLAILPHFLLGWSWETTIYRALIFLVVASPCALMAAIMPTLLSGIANGARQGILFKNGAQLEIIGKVKAIAFDKTGTLTLGKLQVVKITTIECDPQELLEIAAALESVSEHPIGAAIVHYTQDQQVFWSPAIGVQAYVGQGMIGEVKGEKAIVGNLAFIKEQLGHGCDSNLEEKGRTNVWVAYKQKVLGVISLADTLRPEAASVISRLKKLGVEHIVLLTGDNQTTAEAIASEVGITDIYAQLLPEDKLNIIKTLRQRYETVAMVGDGINDAPALATASVGIAMGLSGSDVALETADIVLMADRLEKLETAITLGRRSHTVVKQNIIFALTCITLLLIVNFTSGITLPLGVIGHEGSTVLVTLSGLRLLRK